MMETVRSKCITQLLLLGAIDSIQVSTFHFIYMLLDLSPSIVSLTMWVWMHLVCDTIEDSQNSSSK